MAQKLSVAEALSGTSSVSPVEYLVIAGYLIFMVILGVAFAKLNKNTGDYFRSGSKGSWWLCGASAYMSAISAYTFTAAAGISYYAGWSVLMIYLCNPISQILVYFFYAARNRQKRLTTPGEVYRERFNPATQQTYSIIGLLTGFVGSGMVLYTLAIFVSAVFGFNMQLIIIVLGAVVLFYSISGGRWAVMATDFLQCLIMFSMTILVTVLCLRELGGFGAIFDYIETLGLSSDYHIFNTEARFADVPGYKGFFTWKWGAALLAVNLMGNFSVGAVNYSVKDGKEARKAILFSVMLALTGVIFFFIPAFTARFLYSADVEMMTRLAKPGDGAYAIVCLKLLPPGMLGMMVVAMFAAAMSTMDTSLNGGAGNFIMNVYPPLARLFKWRQRTPEEMLLFSKIYCLCAGLLAIGLSILYSYHKANPLKVILTIGSLLGLPMVIPMFWGLLLKRMPQWTPIVAMTVGFITSSVIYIQMQTGVLHWYYHHQVFAVFAASSATVFLSMLFAKRNPEDYNRRVDGFYTRMNTPVDFETEVGASNDKVQLKVLGRSALAGGVFIMLLVLIADSRLGVICPLAVGGAIALIGGIMLLVSARLKG